MGTQLYTPLYVTVNGTLLAEEFSTTVKRSANSQIVNTVAKGYAGESIGAPMVEIDIDNAIPAVGFEFDPGQNINGLIPAVIGVLGPGGKSLKATGFIISDTIKHAVNQEATISFTFRGSFANFE